ncbi:MAG: LysR family transcriptional regulator [Sarcina sp.]
MDFIDMKFLYAVYKNKNFSKAAEELLVTQPTVSHRIKQLEEELNKPLVLRTKFSREIVLTVEGLKIIESFKKIDKTLKMLKNDMEKVGAGTIELVVPKIEGLRVLENSYLDFYSGVFKQKYNVNIDITTEIDKKLTYKRMKETNNIFRVVFSEEEKFDSELEKYIFFKRYRLYEISFKKSECEKNKTVIFMGKKTLYSKLVRDYLKENNIMVERDIYTNSFELLDFLVEENLGIAYVFEEDNFSKELKKEDIFIQKKPLNKYIYIYFESFKNSEYSNKIYDFINILLDKY